VDPGRVHDRVPPPANDEPAVDGQGDHAGDREREGERAPEQQAAHAGLHGAGDGEHDAVVDELHDRDAERVRRERDRHDRPQRQAGPQQRQARQAVAEQERQADREGDRPQLGEPERGADDHAQDLADGAAGQAVQRGAERDRLSARPLVGISW
jgi:hypothetical protein